MINVGISTAEAENTTALPADSFVESIGVNTHWSYPGVYIDKYNDLKAKLGEAGIRYVRDHTQPALQLILNSATRQQNFKCHTLCAEQHVRFEYCQSSYHQ